MPSITPSFVMGYEREMRAITENTYVNRLKSENIWWNKVARKMPIEKLTERVTWFLETAMIEPVGPAGTGAVEFEDLVTQTVEYPTFKHGRGIIVNRDNLEDLDGSGLNALASWSAQIGNEIAYYPQRLFAQLVLNGANTDGSANAYDGVPYFTALVSGNPHPYNPYRTELGGYYNWLKGTASGTYPGACPIDDSIDLDVALVNLSKVIAYISTVKMSNGVDPRFLTPKYIVAPPRMAARLAQLQGAKFIAMQAGSGAGSADVAALIQSFGLGSTIIAQELGAAITYSAQMPFMGSGGKVQFAAESLTGSDTTYYVVCEEMSSTMLGGLLYVSRKDFKVTYYTGDSGGTAMSAELDRKDQFEYHVKGRMSPAYGHPFAIFRCDQS